MFGSTRWSRLVVLPALLLSGAAATFLHAQQPPQPGAATPADQVAHGRYIVEDVALCGRCHSPVGEHGTRDRSHWLLGGQVGTTPTVPSGDWAIIAPRLAGTASGTDAQFIVLMMTGISRTGHSLRQPMPQFRMSQADAEAVLAYLKSLGGRAVEPAAPAPALTRD